MDKISAKVHTSGEVAKKRKLEKIKAMKRKIILNEAKDVDKIIAIA